MKRRPRWFGHAEHKDDNEWIKHCMMLEAEEIRQTRRLKKTWLDHEKFRLVK